MNTRNWIRLLVLTALMAWPAVETCRLITAKHQLSASLEQQKSIQLLLARVKGVQVAAHATKP